MKVIIFLLLLLTTQTYARTYEGSKWFVGCMDNCIKEYRPKYCHDFSNCYHLIETACQHGQCSDTHSNKCVTDCIIANNDQFPSRDIHGCRQECGVKQ